MLFLNILSIMLKKKPSSKSKTPRSYIESWEDIKGIHQRQGLLCILEIIYAKVMSCHHENFLARHFKIKKIRELVARKDFCSTFRQDIKSYIKGCDISLTSKTVCHKLYRDLQLLLIPTYCLKDLFMDFVTGLLLSID